MHLNFSGKERGVIVAKPVSKKPSGASASGRNGANKSGVASHAAHQRARQAASAPSKSAISISMTIGKPGKLAARKEPAKPAKSARLSAPIPGKAAFPKRPAAPPATVPPAPHAAKVNDRTHREPAPQRPTRVLKPALSPRRRLPLPKRSQPTASPARTWPVSVCATWSTSATCSLQNAAKSSAT